MHLNPVGATADSAVVVVTLKGASPSWLPVRVIRGRCAATPQMALCSAPDARIVFLAARQRTAHLLFRLLDMKYRAADWAGAILRMIVAPPGGQIARLSTVFRAPSFDRASIRVERRAAMLAHPHLTSELASGDALHTLIPRWLARRCVAAFRAAIHLIVRPDKRRIAMFTDSLTSTHHASISQPCNKESYHRQAVAACERAIARRAEAETLPLFRELERHQQEQLRHDESAGDDDSEAVA